MTLTKRLRDAEFWISDRLLSDTRTGRRSLLSEATRGIGRLAGLREQAFIFGAGANGAGFLGRNAWQNGYDLIFADQVQEALDYVDRGEGYPVDVASLDGLETVYVDGVVGSHLLKEGADDMIEEGILPVALDIVRSNLVLTAVKRQNLDSIMPYLDLGLRMFLKGESGHKDIILGENSVGAAEDLRGLLAGVYEWCPAANERIRISDSIIHVMGKSAHVSSTGHIVSELNRADDLVVDADAFPKNPPRLEMSLYAPFDRMNQRKLYLHNLMHMALGLMARKKGYTSIDVAAKDPDVRQLALLVTEVSCRALSEEYGGEDPSFFGYGVLIDHRSGIYGRATGEHLADDPNRLYADPVRKLKREGRVIGPASLCMKHDIGGEGYRGIATIAGMAFHLPEFSREIASSSIEQVIPKYTGLREQDAKERGFMQMIAEEYRKAT